MKHPALTRIFSLVLAVLCLTMLLAGLGITNTAIRSRTADLADHQRLSDRIEEYRQIRASLEGCPSYEEFDRELQQLLARHEKEASQHRIDLAIFTATRGGVNAGEAALRQGEYAYWQGKSQYEAGLKLFEEQEAAFWEGYNQFQEGKRQLAEGRKTLELAETAMAGIHAQIARNRALAAILESDDENARQELTVAAYDSLLQSLDNATQLYGTLKSQGGISAEQMQMLAQMLAQESGTDAGEFLDGVTWEGISAESMEELEARVRQTTGMSMEDIRARIQTQRDEAAAMDADSPISEEQFALLQAAYAQSKLWLDQVNAAMEEKLGEYDAQLAEIRTQLDEAQMQIDAMEPVLEEGRAAIEQGRAALDQAGAQLEMAGQTIWAARAQLEAKKAELKETEKKLREEKERLDREADELAEKSSRAEELKELERQETSVRVMLLERDAIRDRVDGGMDLLDAADEAAGCLLQQLKERFTGRILVAGLMVLGGAAGFAGIPAAFERKKSRLWLIAPVALCLGFAAAVEILCRLLGRGDSYSALGVAVFALIQLALVIPKKKKKT